MKSLYMQNEKILFTEENAVFAKVHGDFQGVSMQFFRCSDCGS